MDDDDIPRGHSPRILDRVAQRRPLVTNKPLTVHGWQVMCIDARWYAVRSFPTEQEAERFAARMAKEERET